MQISSRSPPRRLYFPFLIYQMLIAQHIPLTADEKKTVKGCVPTGPNWNHLTDEKCKHKIIDLPYEGVDDADREIEYMSYIPTSDKGKNVVDPTSDDHPHVPKHITKSNLPTPPSQILMVDRLHIATPSIGPKFEFMTFANTEFEASFQLASPEKLMQLIGYCMTNLRTLMKCWHMHMLNLITIPVMGE